MKQLLQGLSILCPLVTACGSFDDPSIVVDMRILGVIAEPPEVLVPENVAEIEPSTLPFIEVCALVADPKETRELSYSMSACPPNRRGRCESTTKAFMGSGDAPDPEDIGALPICATLAPSPDLAAVIEESISIDSLAGFGAIDIQVEISVWPKGDRDNILYATKQVRFGAQLPPERVPNANPTLTSITVTPTPADEGPQIAEFDLTQERCSSNTIPQEIPTSARLEILPIEAEDTRQPYLVPTFDGKVRSFTENITYQFLGTAGKWSSKTTGGPKDFVGNEAKLDTRWTAPSDFEGVSLDVSIFVIQRDERGGQSWWQSCLRVVK